MTILEILRKEYFKIDENDTHSIDDYIILINNLFLNLENTLLKLKNRNNQIKKLRNKIKFFIYEKAAILQGNIEYM